MNAKSEFIQSLTLESIERAYKGKESPGRSCRCGCNGEYFEASNQEHRGKVVRVLRMIQAHEDLAEVSGEIVDVSITQGKNKRALVFALYLKPEFAGPTEEEQAERGYDRLPGAAEDRRTSERLARTRTEQA